MAIKIKEKSKVLPDRVCVQTQAMPASHFPPQWTYTTSLESLWPGRLAELERIEYDTTSTFDPLIRKAKKKLTKKTMWKYYAANGYKLRSCNCTHEKFSSAYTQFAEFPTRSYSVSGNGNTGDWFGRDMETAEALLGYSLASFTPNYDRWASNCISAVDPYLESWCAEAFDKCSDVLSTQGGRSPEMAQFLIELKDLRSSFQALKHPMRSLISLVGDLTVKGIRRSAKTAASQHLNMMFNVLPNIRDVRDIYSMITRIPALIKQIEENANKDLVFHWRPAQSAIPDFTDINNHYETYRSYSGIREVKRGRQHVAREKLDVNFTIHYSYALPADLMSVKTQALLCMDALGIYANPKILWDEIPFSFVLDWFLKVGSWLEDNFSKRNVIFPVVITDACYTIKCNTLYDFTVGFYGFNGPDEPPPSEFRREMFAFSGRSTNTIFVRRTWVPRPGWISIAAGKPGLTQILLGTSLIATHGL